MSVPEWVVVASVSEAPKLRPKAVYPKGVAVLLVPVDGELVAIANRCAHLGCPLEHGKLEGDVIECPCHDWRFNVRTGQMVVAPEISVPTYPVRIDGDDILVALPGE